MAETLENLDRLCVHTITTKPWSLQQAVEAYQAAGIKGITVWQDALIDRDPVKSGELIRKHDLEVVSYCRGGFFPSTSRQLREKSIDDNRKMIEEAAGLGAPLLVLVCGADPGQNLVTSRDQIREALEVLLPYAEKNKVRLGIEPLHPMYAGDRSAINTLSQANEMAEYFNTSWIGVAVDVYHLWWDPDLKQQIQRCAQYHNLLAFHICDWKVPTLDLLLDRGLMGEGCIPIREIRSWVEENGFKGFNEVEIFSNTYWEMDQQEFLQKIINGYLHHS